MLLPAEDKPIEKYHEEKLKESFDKLSVVQDRSRDELRGLWSKMILLSSGILGFSVSLVSAELLLQQISITFLKLGWFFLIANVGSGLYLLAKETGFQQGESLRESLHQMDRREIGLEKALRKGEEGRRFMALELLHGLRLIPKEKLVSKEGERLIDQYKKSFESWKFIKNPERFYSYKDKRKLNITTKVFYLSFGTALFLLMLSVLFYESQHPNAPRRSNLRTDPSINSGLLTQITPTLESDRQLPIIINRSLVWRQT